VVREERIRAYHDRLVHDFKLDAPTLMPFVLGVPMAKAGADPCPQR